MAKNFFLMDNVGRSGGTWFSRTCNMHPEIKLWPTSVEDARRIVGDLKGEERKKVFFDHVKELYRISPETTTGLIKNNRKTIIDFCKVHHGRMVVTLRNPIGVVIGGTFVAKPHPNETPMQLYDRYLNRFAMRFKSFVSRGKNYPLYRLEDINESLRIDGFYFKKIFEHFTQVEWNQDLIEKVRTAFKKCPECEGTGLLQFRTNCGCCKGLGSTMENNSIVLCPECKGRKKLITNELSNCCFCGGRFLDADISVFRQWTTQKEWQKDMFHKFFDDIMKALGYTYPDG